jgi:hypothetical protein
MDKPITAASLLGPWSGEAPTGLTQRCRDAWDVPLHELSDLMVATFLNQRVAVPEMLEEARRRLKCQECDDTEFYDGQLLDAISEAEKSSIFKP